MTCNTNASLEDLKKKLTEIKPPKIDMASLNSKVSEALADAKGKVNDALGKLEGGLGGAIKQAGTKLQDEIAALQKSGDLNSLQSKIAEINEKFGKEVGNLDTIIDTAAGKLETALADAGGIDGIIDKATDGINTALAKIDAGSFETGFEEAQDKLNSFLSGNLELPDVCTVCPNIEALPSGEVIEQPTQEVTPTAPPIEPVPKPAVNTTALMGEYKIAVMEVRKSIASGSKTFFKDWKNGDMERKLNEFGFALRYAAVSKKETPDILDPMVSPMVHFTFSTYEMLAGNTYYTGLWTAIGDDYTAKGLSVSYQLALGLMENTNN